MSIADDQRRWRRFLTVTLAFLAYEAIVIVGFGGSVNSDSTAVAVVVVALAAVGFFGLGYFSGSLISLPVSLLPILIAINADVPQAANSLAGESVPFFVRCVFLSALLLPICVLGIFVSDSTSGDD